MGGPYYDSDGEDDTEPSRSSNSPSLPDYGGKPFGADGKNKPGAYGGDVFSDLDRVKLTGIGLSINGIGATKHKDGKTTIDIDKGGIGGSVGASYDPETGKWKPTVSIGGPVPISPYSVGASYDPTNPNPNASASVGAGIKRVIDLTIKFNFEVPPAPDKDYFPDENEPAGPNPHNQSATPASDYRNTPPTPHPSTNPYGPHSSNTTPPAPNSNAGNGGARDGGSLPRVTIPTRMSRRTTRVRRAARASPAMAAWGVRPIRRTAPADPHPTQSAPTAPMARTATPVLATIRVATGRLHRLTAEPTTG